MTSDYTHANCLYLRPHWATTTVNSYQAHDQPQTTAAPQLRPHWATQNWPHQRRAPGHGTHQPTKTEPGTNHHWVQNSGNLVHLHRPWVPLDLLQDPYPYSDGHICQPSLTPSVYCGLSLRSVLHHPAHCLPYQSVPGQNPPIVRHSTTS